MRNKFAFLVISKKNMKVLYILLLGIFVCVALISVKSKYGSRSGSCAGLINFNNNILFLFIFISDKDIVFFKQKPDMAIKLLLLVVTSSIRI